MHGVFEATVGDGGVGFVYHNLSAWHMRDVKAGRVLKLIRHAADLESTEGFFILHDLGDSAVNPALPDILAMLKEKGFTMVHLCTVTAGGGGQAVSRALTAYVREARAKVLASRSGELAGPHIDVDDYLPASAGHVVYTTEV